MISRDLFKNKSFEGRYVYSWETPPEPIPEDKIISAEEADVVVVGAGISGMCAAGRASQLGMSVIIIEKGSGPIARGAQMGALDSRVMRAKGIHIDKKQFVREWIKISGNRCKEELVWTFANRSGEMMDWLLSLGEGKGVGCEIYGGYYKGPVYTEYPGTHILTREEDSPYKHSGAMLANEMFEEQIREHKNKMYFFTRAEQLEQKDRRVTGVIASSKDGYKRFKAKKGVILATGDIGGDPEMLAAYAPLGLKPKMNWYIPPGMNTGDGHKMGYWAGGAFEDAPWPTMIHLLAYAFYCFFFLFVNSEGNRFMNEDNWVQAKAIKVLQQPGDADYAYTIFDSKWIDEIEEKSPLGGGQFWEPLVTWYGKPWNRDNGIPETIEGYIEKGFCFRADTLEELAAKLEVPYENLKRSVDRYNELYEMGDDADFGKRAELLTSISKPPYYGLKWGPALLTVDGGLNIDTRMRVLDRENKVIDGLYAVGNVSGGLYGVDYPVILNGNSNGRGMLWGYIAANDCAGLEK